MYLAILDELSELEILTLTIYGEARGEVISGQVAVGCVIRNRKDDRDSYHDICLKQYQFSCWNTFDLNYSILIELAEILHSKRQIANPDYQQCFWVAQGVIDNLIKDNTGGAKNYLTVDMFNNNRPRWAKFLKSTPKEIGNQVFFNV